MKLIVHLESWGVAQELDEVWNERAAEPSCQPVFVIHDFLKVLAIQKQNSAGLPLRIVALIAADKAEEENDDSPLLFLGCVAQIAEAGPNFPLADSQRLGAIHVYQRSGPALPM